MYFYFVQAFIRHGGFGRGVFFQDQVNPSYITALYFTLYMSLSKRKCLQDAFVIKRESFWFEENVLAHEPDQRDKQSIKCPAVFPMWLI